MTVKLTRKPDRAAGREDLDAILDAGRVGTLAAVVDGGPQVVPVLYGRVGDEILLHGSSGAGTLRAAAAGGRVAFEVHHLDGLVYAESLFESSANYRSAVVYGECRRLTGEDADAALLAMSEQVMPGRTAEVRGNTKKDLAATITLALPIVDGEWMAKERTGGPGAREEEYDGWTGVLPIRQVYGEPIPADDCPKGVPVAPSVTRLAQS